MNRPDKTVFIKSYGCQMNVYDSSRMADILGDQGYRQVETPDAADLVILNTCHIREKAAEKVYSELGRLRKIRDAGVGAATIAVAGCVAQAEGEEILARAPVVDLVFGPQSYHRLPEFLKRVDEGDKVVDTEFPREDKFDHMPAASRTRTEARGRTAFITVQEGCDKFCTFCVVPYTRGAENSRPAQRILDEARRLTAMGVREITLLGQNVNAYHGAGRDGRDWSLARLLTALSEIDGLDRLRYTTSHPRDMTDDLIAVHRDLGKLMPYLHLPVQSGSDRILKAMNRRHSRALYLAVIERLREAQPDLALSSDFIVGFPGETEDDFNDTLDLIERVGFAQAYSFKYSPRPGTPAADADDQVQEATKSERLARLQTLLRRQRTRFAESLSGKTLSVLYEKPGRRSGQVIGRSPYLQPVVVSGDEALVGSIEDVEVTGSGPNSLFARRLTGETLARHVVEVRA